MFLKKNVKKSRGRKYYQYVLVESVRTPKGPRHNIVVSLGDLSPRPPKEWLKLISKVEEALIEQLNFFLYKSHTYFKEYVYSILFSIP